MTNEEVNAMEELLRQAQEKVEAAGRMVCSSHNETAIAAWHALTNMTAGIADVIHTLYKLRPTFSEE